MKKRLEAELISIAHRILKLKNKSEVDQLYKETQKLYETLSVLKFYQDNFESVKSDLKLDALEEKLAQAHEQESVVVAEVKETNVEVVPETDTVIEETQSETEADDVEEQIQPETEEEIEEALAEEALVSEEPEASLEEETPLEEPTVVEEEETVVDPKPAFEPIFQLDVEEEEEAEIAVAETASEVQPKEKLEDMIGNYADPVFVKPNEVTLFPTEIKEEETTKEEAPKSAIVNDTHSKSIAIGLNDRIGFVQHLFNDSNEDFNRVISQLNTFDTFEEAKAFINDMVIPDYNYWVGEEDYIERFMEIVEKKFQ
ncbi:hypothetical protein [Flavobacterium sp. 25HG05S-40]|uniref:hypothetical protein n=1 Tax=Flavobacterium sp. 25HG05S-40 TaxID=3458682 RepID=UPI00404413A8